MLYGKDLNLFQPPQLLKQNWYQMVIVVIHFPIMSTPKETNPVQITNII